MSLPFGHHVHIGQEQIGGKESAVDPLRFLADRGDMPEQLVDIPRDRNIFHPSDDFALLNLEGQAERVGECPGDYVALPDAEQVFDQDALVNPSDDLFERSLARLEYEIGGGGLNRPREALPVVSTPNRAAVFRS